MGISQSFVNPEKWEPCVTEEEGLFQFDRFVLFYRIAFASHPQFIEQTRNASFKTLSDPKYCGKMKVLRGLLSVFHKERCKVLLFSLSTKVNLFFLIS